MALVLIEGSSGRSAVREALAGLARLFADERSRQGWLARRALGCVRPDDGELREWLAGELCRDLRPDGSVGGALVPTAWRAAELLDLEHRTGDGLGRLVGWVLGRQGAPGAYGEGCTPPRHHEQVCEHYIGGFFSAAPAEQRVAPITLPSGKAFRAEGAARLAVSCLALRTVLRAGAGERPLVRRHLAALAHIAGHCAEWDGYFGPDAIFSVLGGLAPAGGEYAETVDALVALAARHQLEDGTWPVADLFHALDALLAVGTPAALALVRRAVPGLLSRQRADGSFGSTARLERALIAVRALGAVG